MPAELTAPEQVSLAASSKTKLPSCRASRQDDKQVEEWIFDCRWGRLPPATRLLWLSTSFDEEPGHETRGDCSFLFCSRQRQRQYCFPDHSFRGWNANHSRYYHNAGAASGKQEEASWKVVHAELVVAPKKWNRSKTTHRVVGLLSPITGAPKLAPLCRPVKVVVTTAALFPSTTWNNQGPGSFPS